MKKGGKTLKKRNWMPIIFLSFRRRASPLLLVWRSCGGLIWQLVFEAGKGGWKSDSTWLAERLEGVWELLKAVKKSNNSIFMQANRSVLVYSAPQNTLYTSSYTKISSKKCALISWRESSVTSNACIVNAEQF